MPITKQRRMQNKQKIYLSQKRKWKFSNNWRWFKRLSTSQAWCFTQTCPVCLEEDTHRLPRTFNACCSPPPRSLFSPQTESCWAVWLACRKITPVGIRGYWKDKQFTFWDECVGDFSFLLQTFIVWFNFWMSIYSFYNLNTFKNQSTPFLSKPLPW